MTAIHTIRVLVEPDPDLKRPSHMSDHRRRLRGAVATAIVLWLTAACAGSASTSSLDKARAQWAAKPPAHYRMTWFKRAMIGESRVVVEVRDGKVVAAKALKDDLQLMPVRDLTVEAVFAEVRKAETESASVEASYDPELGYPRMVRVDVDERSIDDEYDFGIQMLDAI